MNIKEIKYQYNQDIVIRDGENVKLAFNPETTDIYEFNESAGEILEMLERNIPFTEILSQLCEVYDCTEEDIIEDVTLLAERMLELGIIILQ